MTANNTAKEPFEQDEALNKPGIVGARWWQKSLGDTPSVSRRAALRGALIVGGALVGLAGLLAVIGAAGNDDDTRTESRSALEMQREYGWNFGAATENLTFDGLVQQAFDPAALDRLPSDLRPARADLGPYDVPTLLQSPSALPRSSPTGDPTPVTPLRDVLRPIMTPAMDSAYRRGRGLASLFNDVGRGSASAVPSKGLSPGVALVVDLPGPEAVAFAAGAAEVFDPVFTFDNWPHPRGVVPAHQTLAACAYYQPLFARTGAARPKTAPPMFVLDRRRLSPYTDNASQFDNRHIGRLPGDHALGPLGVKRVLYVVPTDQEALELDDLNDDFVLYDASHIDLKLVAASALAPEDAGAPPAIESIGKSYKPKPRATAYSSGAPSGSIKKPVPPDFGTVPVVVALGTGVILGAVLSRSGTWNRSGGGSGG